jgi:two-component system, NarL family, sensor histidine kinase UhpB
MPSTSATGEFLSTPPPQGARGGRDHRGRLREAAAAVPILHKILVAHAGLLLLTVLACALFARGYMASGEGFPAVIAFGGIAALALAALAPIHFLIVRLALAPVAALEKVAARVEAGDTSARVEDTPFADPRLARVTLLLNQLLDRLVDERQKLRNVAAHAFRAQEAERTRLARELQEEAAQRLANLLLRLRIARTAGVLTDGDEYEHLRAEILDVLAYLRDYATGLFPPALRELGIGASLTALARTLSETSHLRVVARADDVSGLLTADQELALFRIVQEAAGNAVRHAAASNIEISLCVCGAEVRACVQDDGVGFSPERALEALPCLGIVGMQERALYADGSLSIESAPGRGTRVCIALATSGPFPLTPPTLAAAAPS